MKSRIVSNTSWLMLAYVGGLLIPLIELPFLAHALGPGHYGQVLFTLGISLTVSVFVEFGFNLSAARQLIHLQGDAAAQRQLVYDVALAKLILFCGAGGIAITALALGLGKIAIPPAWFVWIALLTVAFGFSPNWFFVGTARLGLPAITDIGVRTIELLLIITLIKHPSDAVHVLMILSVSGLTNTLIPSLVMVRRAGVCRPRLAGAWRAIRQAWSLFLYRGAQNVLASMTTTLLGLLGGARAVGLFVPAEKIVRAATGLANPVFSALFPHMVDLSARDPDKARKVNLILIGILLASTVTFGMLFSWIAPWLINLMFGHDYIDSVPVLRLLVWVVPARIINSALATLWFIPLGRERAASNLMLLDLVSVLLLALILIPSFGATGLALSMLISDTAMLCLMLFLLTQLPRARS